MARFSYIARSPGGEKVQGTVEAPDRRSAIMYLDRKKLVPVSISESAAPAPVLARSGADGDGAKGQAAPKPAAKPGPAPGATPAKPKPGAPSARPKPAAGAPKLSLSQRLSMRRKAAGLREPRMGLRDVLTLTRELSDLIRSGMTLGNALNTLARRKTKKAQDTILADVRDEIIKGAALSEALGRWPRTFSSLYVSMVRAGEASGTLAESLERLAKHYERVAEAREKVMMALTYPAIVVIFGAVTIVFTMIYVIPKFTAVFADLKATLPLPTRMLIGMSSFLLKYGLVMLGLIVMTVTMLRKYVRTPDGMLRWHRLHLRVPVVKKIVEANAFAQFARTLGALLANGVPVLQALNIVEGTMGNKVIADEIKEARERVTDGSTISGPLAAGKVFPGLLTDMLAVGEESGDMSGALSHIAARYDSELDRSIKVMTTVLEPVLILSIALGVGFVAVSMLMAVFELTRGLNV